MASIKSKLKVGLSTFSFLRYLHIWLDFLVMQEKRLDCNDRVKFEIDDVTTWLAKNCSTQIA